MTEKICTSGHVMNDGDVTCPRCGASAQLQDNQNTNMESEENKVVAEDQATDTALEKKAEGETVAPEGAVESEATPEAPAEESTEAKSEETPAEEASADTPAA